MADRETLIVRKQAVRRRIEQLRRTLEREQAKVPPPQRQISRLETELEKLMAEEYNLRVAIDQAR
jgi:chromosome segregation ATPase